SRRPARTSADAEPAPAERVRAAPAARTTLDRLDRLWKLQVVPEEGPCLSRVQSIAETDRMARALPGSESCRAVLDRSFRVGASDGRGVAAVAEAGASETRRGRVHLELDATALVDGGHLLAG